MSETTYQRDKMTLKCNHMGNLGKKTFHHITCNLCMDIVLPIVKSEYNFQPDDTPRHIIESWESKNISTKYLDLAGCLIPLEKHVFVGPNARRFISRPGDHDLHNKIVKKHVKTSVIMSGSTTLVTATTAASKSNLTSSATSNKTTITSNQAMVLSEKPIYDSKGNSIILGKARSIAKFTPIDRLIDPKIQLKESCSSKADIWSSYDEGSSIVLLFVVCFAVCCPIIKRHCL